jgi:hypothetical protein
MPRPGNAETLGPFLLSPLPKSTNAPSSISNALKRLADCEYPGIPGTFTNCLQQGDKPMLAAEENPVQTFSLKRTVEINSGLGIDDSAPFCSTRASRENERSFRRGCERRFHFCLLTLLSNAKYRVQASQ